MKAFSLVSSKFIYAFEGLFINSIAIKIDRFDLDKDENNIIVIFRIGRQRLTQKLYIFDFTKKYFENLSSYDRQRVSKYSTLQDLLIQAFPTDGACKKALLNYIKTAVKNDQLF